VSKNATAVNVETGSATSQAAGGSASAVVQDSGDRHYSGSYEVRNVPNPPEVIANPTAPCRIGVGVSGSGVGFGFGVGSSVLDEGCDTREDARLLFNMGLHDAALMRLCAKPEMAAAIFNCPKPEPKAANYNGTGKLY
jgi:hypothetical protein